MLQVEAREQEIEMYHDIFHFGKFSSSAALWTEEMIADFYLCKYILTYQTPISLPCFIFHICVILLSFTTIQLQH